MGDQENTDMKALFNEIVSMRTSQEESDKKINAKLDNIQSSFQPLQQEVATHSKELKYLDYEKRRKNLIVFGLQESSEEAVRDLENKVLHLIVNTLNIRDFTLAELDFSRRQGKRVPTGGVRSVMVAFTTQRRKFEILKNKSKLKGSNIYINEDSSPAAREQEKQLRSEMRRLRSEGKYAVIRSGRLITADHREPPPSTTNNTTRNKRALTESPTDSPPRLKRIHANNSVSPSDEDSFLNELNDQDVHTVDRSAPNGSGSKNG